MAVTDKPSLIVGSLGNKCQHNVQKLFTVCINIKLKLEIGEMNLNTFGKGMNPSPSLSYGLNSRIWKVIVILKNLLMQY